mmetsp:Transcript_27054/g.76113  ORF Transcript_27054/g.76113 Transcript_27054/m.76113 type:complete len:205 (+) Transcript_27054:959-1573(+)
MLSLRLLLCCGCLASLPNNVVQLMDGMAQVIVSIITMIVWMRVADIIGVSAANLLFNRTRRRDHRTPCLFLAAHGRISADASGADRACRLLLCPSHHNMPVVMMILAAEMRQKLLLKNSFSYLIVVVGGGRRNLPPSTSAATPSLLLVGYRDQEIGVKWAVQNGGRCVRMLGAHLAAMWIFMIVKAAVIMIDGKNERVMANTMK